MIGVYINIPLTDREPRTCTILAVLATISSFPVRMLKNVFPKDLRLSGFRLDSLRACIKGSLASSDMEQDLGRMYFCRVSDNSLNLERINKMFLLKQGNRYFGDYYFVKQFV